MQRCQFLISSIKVILKLVERPCCDWLIRGWALPPRHLAGGWVVKADEKDLKEEYRDESR